MNIKYRLLISLLIVASFVACSTPQKKENGQNKPNIIYILADDLGYADLSCYGQTNFKTPNIDQLAANGMLFTQHYSGSTVCAPSRSSLMTGQHTGHTPIRGNKEIKPEGQFPIPAESVTVAEILKNRGYITGCFGKWGLGFPGSEGDPNNQGFDKFFGYNCHMLAHNYYPAFLRDNQEKVFLEGNVDDNFVEYAPYIIQDEALGFIERNKDKPFFLYYASIIPHAELYIPEDRLNVFRNKFLPEKNYKGATFGHERFRIGGYGTQEESHAAFAAMVTLLDEQVGEIVEKVNELGIADNTIIIFTSDNGPHFEGGADPDYFNSNGDLKGFKRDLYEGGIRVPMIASWPGKIEKGVKSNHVSAFWDVLPTFSEMAGATYPKEIDGVSFLPTLLGKKGQKEHDYLYWEFHEKGGRLALRKGDWKIVKYNSRIGDKPIELYNLTNDVSEVDDLSQKHPEIVKEMEQLMNNARAESADFYLDY